MATAPYPLPTWVQKRPRHLQDAPQLRLTPGQGFPLAMLSCEQIFPGQDFGRVGAKQGLPVAVRLPVVPLPEELPKSCNDSETATENT